MIAKGLPVIGNTNFYREIINDRDSKLINFYDVMQDVNMAEKLLYRLENTLYSREYHQRAREHVYGDNAVDDAWAYVVATVCSFSNIYGKAYGFSVNTDEKATTFNNTKKKLAMLTDRLKCVTIENDDALDIIKRYDREWTCFYCDPPYPGSEQGHYSGYTQQDFEALIDLAKDSKGSFVISNYHNDAIDSDFTVYEKTTTCSVAVDKNTHNDFSKKRTEILAVIDRSHTCPSTGRGPHENIQNFLWTPTMGDKPLPLLSEQ